LPVRRTPSFPHEWLPPLDSTACLPAEAFPFCITVLMPLNVVL
jgi:hypothetical protein